MVAAAFTINQTDGAGSGTLGRSRSGLWRNQVVDLVAEDAGEYIWGLLDKPGGSYASLSSNTGKTVTIAPDVNGTYLISLKVGRSTMVLLFRVSRDETGLEDGVWAIPAFGEGAFVDNEGGNERGSTPQMEYIFGDIYNKLSGLLSGELGTGVSNYVIYWPGGPEFPGVYTTFASALAAALEIPGIVDLIINGDDATITILAGTYNLQNRINLRGVSRYASIPQLFISAGVSLQNVRYVEYIKLRGTLTTPLFSVTSGQLDILFRRFARTSGYDGDELFTLAAGTNRIHFIESAIEVSTAPMCTLATGNDLDLLLEHTSVNDEAIHGSTGALMLRRDGGSSCATPNFSGTLTLKNETMRSFRFMAVAGVQATDPADGTSWKPVGVVYIDPSLLPAVDGSVRQWTFHADVGVTEASPNTVHCEVQIVDSTSTELTSVSNNLGDGVYFPKHLGNTLTAGEGDGEVQSSAAAYLVQIRRHGGSVGDVATLYNAYVEVTWSLAPFLWCSLRPCRRAALHCLPGGPRGDLDGAAPPLPSEGSCLPRGTSQTSVSAAQRSFTWTLSPA